MLGYRATLARGYAVIRGDDALVTTAADAAKATVLEIEFADGKLAALPSTAPQRPKKPVKTQEPPPEQGSLL
jgi:exodeoxyribonuclease VII large subunit